MSALLGRDAALGCLHSQGSRVGSGARLHFNVAPSMTSRHPPCSCQATSSPSFSGRVDASSCAGQQVHDSEPDLSKYQRIAAFIDAHATPVFLADIMGSTDGSYDSDWEQPNWRNSYDEEAEEGEQYEQYVAPQYLAESAATPAGSVQLAAPENTQAAQPVVIHSWSYDNPVDPKPWHYSWDEEAEGAFELAVAASSSNVCSSNLVALQQAREQRRAAFQEARHAARVSRRIRRSQLHPQLGDLEHMQAWVQPLQERQRRVHYKDLLAFVAGDATSGQYRKPKQWHLTFDEDVHGDAPDAVLGSC